MESVTDQPAALFGDRKDRFVLAAAVVLLVAAFLPTIIEMVKYWADFPEYGHGFLMPFVAGWILWERRAELRKLEARPSLVGFLLLIASLALLLLGEMKLSWFLKPYALVFCLGALVWAFYGWKAVRVFLPSLLVLLLMCPLPGRIQNDISLPLKRSASLLATGMLDVVGIPASLEGNLIHVNGLESLWVADACSGIRSLISLVSIAIIAVLFWPRHVALRIAVVLSAIPIAVLVNSLRIWLTGVISVQMGQEAAQGVFHFLEGFVLFGVAALLLLGWAVLLGRLFRKDPA